MRLGDTIGAPCTASGRSGRAAIRISGDRVHQVVEQLLDGAPSGRGAGRATFDLGGGRCLPVLVLRFDAGASYTSEDVLEILLPGNRVLVERVLARCLETEDVRLAAPGEFTARAYLNGRLSLEQAEGIGATIGAETDGQLASARDLLEGRTGRRYRAWADELTTILALVEAGIDFTDQEDVVAIAPDELRERVSAIEAAMGSLLGGDEPEATAADVPLVVLVGAPNAGKSTLFNALLGRRRSVVSELAGTTRDVIIERLDLAPEAPGAGEIRLADPAGLDAIGGQAEAQRSARRAIDEADVLIWCDPTGQFALEGIDASRPTIRVRTKADLPGAAGGADVHVCALDAWHLGSLRRAIADGAWSRRGSSEVVVTRHRRALANARAHLRSGQALDDAEVIAGELRAALDALGELVGRIHPDDVIGRVFATFCVGK